MNTSTYRPFASRASLLSAATLAVAFMLGAGQARAAGPDPVDLGAAGTYVILTKTGITNVPISDITGNLGTSPINATAITGFSLKADSTNVFSKATQVSGKVYAANYAAPTPANLTTAVSNMEDAYTDAAGRALPDFTELYAGDLSGRTLAPGLYKWSSGVLITTKVTLAGAASDVWIFQIAGNLTIGSGARVVRSGGAQAKNVFWQVGGGTGVEIGTTAHVEGNILAQKAIHLRTGASLNGRALAQTAVTLEKNTLVIPSSSAPSKLAVFLSDGLLDGSVFESSEGSGEGGSKNSTSTSFRVGDDEANKQVRGILSFDTSSLPDTATIIDASLVIKFNQLTGVDPFSTHGLLLADVSKRFGLTKLESGDFQAAANASAVATFSSAPVNGWYSASLNAQGRSFVSATGTTQFRLRFATDDNNDFTADFLKFASGDADRARRPQLEVRYTP